jgi:integration host factor subunit alpha
MSNPLTKAVIVESVHNRLRIPRKDCTEIVETLLEIIKSTLESGEDVLISGFGKFNVKKKGERKGRNPATGDDLMLEPRRVVTFNCSATLRSRVNGE